jgi:hypothetical protein
LGYRGLERKVVFEVNWKYEAIDKLRDYEAKKQALESIPKEIECLEMAFEGIRSSTTDGTPVKGGGGSREDMMLNNIVKRDELKRALEQAQVWVDMVDKGLSMLSEEERTVLDRFFIHHRKGNVNRLCEELFIEQSTAYRWKDQALRKFTISLYGVVES